MNDDKQSLLNHGPYDKIFIRRIHILGIILPVLLLWNGVSDLLYAYSPVMSGQDYFSSRLWDVISTAGGRTHGMIMLAQTAGWFYPLLALIYYIWWIGMSKAGFWMSAVPTGLLAYATLMMSGTVRTGLAYLSVLSQAKAAVGSSDPVFYEMVNHYIIQHFIRANLTVVAALIIGAVWHCVAILSGRTLFPRWFVFFSPLPAAAVVSGLGVMLPAPAAGFVLAPLSTWFMLIPTLASTLWLWKRME